MQETLVAQAVRDLWLWDVLFDADAPIDALTRALESLRAAPEDQLFALLSGALPALARHEAPAVRAATAAALARATGQPAGEALVTLLDDEEEGVRRAAVAAAASHSPVLATLALLHKRADVRHALLDLPSPPPWDELGFLLTDPESAPHVRARLDREAHTPSVARTVLRAHATGLMPADEARARLEQLPWDAPHDVLPLLRFTFSVSDKELLTPEGIEAALARAWMRDSLTEVLDLCCTSPSGPAGAPQLDDDTPVARAFVRAMQRGRFHPHEHRRLALAILVKALTHGAAPPRLLSIALAVAPGALGLRLPPEHKRRALAACVDTIPADKAGGAKLAALPRDLLVVDGTLHLRAIAGAMRLVAPEPYRALAALEPDRARLLAAIEKSPRDAAALLSLPAPTQPERTAHEALLREVLALPLPPRTLGALALALPHQSLAALEALDKQRPGAAEELLMALADALVRLEPEAGVVHEQEGARDQRVQRISGALAKQIAARALPRLIADLVTHDGAVRGRVGALLSALVRAAGPALATDVVRACRPDAEAALVDVLDDLPMSARLERAYAQALADSTRTTVRTWSQVRIEKKSEPLTLEEDSARALRSASDDDVRGVLADALRHHLENVSPLLLDRTSLPRDAASAAGALCLGYPLHHTAALFQRIVVEDARFLSAIDAALLAPGVRTDLPLFAAVWLHAHPQQRLRFDWMARTLSLGGLLDLACELPCPLLALKLAEGIGQLARTWARARPSLFERHCSSHLAERCAALLLGTLRARPAEGGASKLDATRALRFLAAELVRLAHDGGARTSSLVDDVRAACAKAGPVPIETLDDELARALRPAVDIARPPSTAASSAPATTTAVPDDDAMRDAFDDALARSDVRGALDAACAPAGAHWLDPDRLGALTTIADARRLALGLATSPHPAAYTKAVYALDALLRDERDAPDEAARGALRAFLRAGDDRNLDLRAFAAESLARVGVLEPFLWLRGLLGDASTDELRARFREHGRDITRADWARVLRGAQVAARQLDPALNALLHACPLDDRLGADIARHLVTDPELEDDDARALFIWVRRARVSEDPRVRGVRDALRWGVLQGRKLLGRPISVELIHDAWGYTRLGTPRIHVNPLPLLRGERNGDEVVRGLMVHEIGHQLYHADPESRRIWDDAGKRKLQSLLNLVADEHLERNLRSVSDLYGDHLKALCSHAFQHANTETQLEQLLDTLGARAFPALARAGLVPGLRWGSVRVDVGRLLRELAAAGGSFAKFVRALRQGLGLRDADDKVKEALALFTRRTFRASRMPDLMRITEELVRIFGQEIEILQTVGLHEALDSSDRDVLAEGLTPEELKELGPRTPTKGARGRPVFNKGDDEHFDVIDDIVALPHDPAAHRAVALEARRGSTALRRAFEQLGLRAIVERRRLTGRALDRTGVASAVIRRDPRVLVKRTLQPAPDLFVGVVVDCSGSMQQHQAIERARAFATLIAEAARGLPGIDVRVLGFTDRVIYDAGDEERCAAHALQASGGNNDAAGLWHAASLARQSKRRARLLVMISDGLPTECTLSSLRALVTRLERQGTCCAQVAVRPIADHAFRHYVEILDDDVDPAARRFAAVVTRLVKSTVR